jgi:hypothetical protein
MSGFVHFEYRENGSVSGAYAAGGTRRAIVAAAADRRNAMHPA